MKLSKDLMKKAFPTTWDKSKKTSASADLRAYLNALTSGKKAEPSHDANILVTKLMKNEDFKLAMLELLASKEDSKTEEDDDDEFDFSFDSGERGSTSASTGSMTVKGKEISSQELDKMVRDKTTGEEMTLRSLLQRNSALYTMAVDARSKARKERIRKERAKYLAIKANADTASRDMQKAREKLDKKDVRAAVKVDLKEANVPEVKNILQRAQWTLESVLLRTEGGKGRVNYWYIWNLGVVSTLAFLTMKNVKNAPAKAASVYAAVGDAFCRATRSLANLSDITIDGETISSAEYTAAMNYRFEGISTDPKAMTVNRHAISCTCFASYRAESPEINAFSGWLPPQMMTEDLRKKIRAFYVGLDEKMRNASKIYGFNYTGTINFTDSFAYLLEHRMNNRTWLPMSNFLTIPNSRDDWERFNKLSLRQKVEEYEKVIQK